MAFTTLAEETTLLATLVATGRVAVDQVGTSVLGKPIRLLRVGDPPPVTGSRAVVLITGTQHGNELGGREGILEFADYLSTTTDAGEISYLQTHGLLLMPTCNPDGVESVVRENASGLDTNRDHITLATPEARALATVLRDYRPALVVDLHEGNVSPDDTQLLHPTVPQVDPINVSRSQQAVNAIGTWFTGTLSKQPGVWPGGDTETILRNTCGLRRSAGLVAENNITGGEADRIANARGCCDAILQYAMAVAVDLLADVDAADASRAAVGAAADAPFDVRTAVIDPPPVGYQLTVTQQQSTFLHRGLFGITGSAVVSMAQAGQPVIPFLLDGVAEFNIVSATRLFPSASGGGEEPVAPVAQARIRRRVTWLGCDLATGTITQELPDITGEISRVVGRYTSASLSVPIPLGGPGSLPISLVERSTDPARTLLVAVVNDVPSWAGIPLPSEGGTGPTLQLGVVSAEGYLLHRYVRDHTWTQQDEASVIAAGLLADAGTIPGLGSGIAMTVDAPSTGRRRDREYKASDHKTVYDALVELMGVIDGPEWTIDVDWAENGADPHRSVTLVARVRPRIGRPATTPTSVFQISAGSAFGSRSASDATYSLLVDRSGDRYANVVQAYSSGEGDDQPVSDLAVDQDQLDLGVPTWERHFQPSSNIINVATLDEHAQAELARIRDGARVLSIEARHNAYPRMGVDWQLGDDIGWELYGHRHPNGLVGQGRAVGWELDTARGVVTPLLQEV